MVPGAQDTLESLHEPGPLDAHDNDPVVQEGEQLGSGVGDEEEGDHVEEAVVRVADEKVIPTQLGITDGAQTTNEISAPQVEVPSSSLIQEPGAEKNDVLINENENLPAETTPPHKLDGMESASEPERDNDQGSPQDQHVASPPGDVDGNQVSTNPESDQASALPAVGEQAPAIDAGIKTQEVTQEVVQDEPVVAFEPKVGADVIQEREVIVSDDQVEPKEQQQDLLEDLSTQKAAPEDAQPEEPRTKGLLKEDAPQGPDPEQNIAEDATYQDLANVVVQDNEQRAESAYKSTQNENHLQEAGPAVHETSSGDTDGANHPLNLGHESIDETQRRSTTTDKSTEMLGEETIPQHDVVDEVRPISSVEPHSPEAVPLHEKPPESLPIVDEPSSSDQAQAVQRHDDQPSLGRADSSTQTDEPWSLWRPISPLQRGATPGIVLPDLNDNHAKGMSRARSIKKLTRRNSRKAEEAVAAAVIIRATADTMGQTNANRLDVDKDLKQHGHATTRLKSFIDRRGTGAAVTDTPRVPYADSVVGKDDNVPKSPRVREHRSSHSSRSDRPSTRDGAAKTSHHRHSTHEQSSPRTPPRRRDTGESHSSRSKRERTPQEQAEHDKRKEERRREKEEREKAKAESPEAKTKDVEGVAAADRPHKTSRRYSSSRNGPETTPAKKLFSGESVVEPNFGGSIKADATAPAVTKEKDITKPPPAELKRSNTSRKGREPEVVKTTKDEGKGRGASSSPAPSADSKKRRGDDKHRKSRSEKREKEEKNEKKKSSGGIKGMFKKLFS